MLPIEARPSVIHNLVKPSKTFLPSDCHSINWIDYIPTRLPDVPRECNPMLFKPAFQAIHGLLRRTDHTNHKIGRLLTTSLLLKKNAPVTVNQTAYEGAIHGIGQHGPRHIQTFIWGQSVSLQNTCHVRGTEYDAPRLPIILRTNPVRLCDQLCNSLHEFTVFRYNFNRVAGKVPVTPYQAQEPCSFRGQGIKKVLIERVSKNRLCKSSSSFTAVFSTLAHWCTIWDTWRGHMSIIQAYSQRCHLTYDAQHHARNAEATRRAKRGTPLFPAS